LRSLALAIGLLVAAAAAGQAQAPKAPKPAPPSGMTQQQFDTLVDAITKSVADKLKADGIASPAKPDKPPAAEAADAFGAFFAHAGEAARAIPTLGRQFATIPRLLDESERATFAADFGLKEPSHDRVLRAIFEATEQITFFTSDEKEVRAWLLRRGSTALDAAGTIHTDLARGFIRAEIMAVDDLLRLGSEREVKAANLHYTVGKDHAMRDGDEIVIKFSV
jgi:ribosome-binding ATPase YchF (GTP1/OBG family)